MAFSVHTHIFVIEDLASYSKFQELASARRIEGYLSSRLGPVYFIRLMWSGDAIKLERITAEDVYGQKTKKLTAENVEELTFLDTAVIKHYLLSL